MKTKEIKPGIAVLGAGYMGSAVTFPLSDNNTNISLWGTWLDDDLISSSSKGRHPKLNLPLPSSVKLFYWQDLDKAIKDCEIIYIGIASEGFTDVFEKLVERLEPDRDYFFFKLTKGLVEYDGKIMRASEAAGIIFRKRFPERKFFLATVGGPVRALDLANRIPSATVYGVKEEFTGVLRSMLPFIATDYYRVFVSGDGEAVEICSTFKNIYAMSAGICDGLYKEKIPGLYHNLVAFLFTVAGFEIARVCELFGGDAKTATGFAGIGDLHVTSAAGRNRRYGELIGKGVGGEEAFQRMYKEGEYGEGFVALKLAVPWIMKSLGRDIGFIRQELPLLFMLYSVVFENKDLKQSLEILIKNL
jgi:glycerol-3-phosphate dehydrogenase (NAD(P)+)